MTDATAQGLVIVTYLAALGRAPESVQVIAQGAEATKQHFGAYAASVTNSEEGLAWRDRLKALRAGRV